MSNNLRKQLLKAGVVNKKQVKKAQVELRKQGNDNKDNKESAQKALQEQKAHTQACNKQKELEKQQKALHNHIQQLLETQAIEKALGDIRYNFRIANKIKYTYVNKEQQQQLAQGKIGIIWLAEDQLHLIAKEGAVKILKFNQEAPVVWHNPEIQDSI